MPNPAGCWDGLQTHGRIDLLSYFEQYQYNFLFFLPFVLVRHASTLLYISYNIDLYPLKTEVEKEKHI
jgi:hypothetical protein